MSLDGTVVAVILAGPPDGMPTPAWVGPELGCAALCSGYDPTEVIDLVSSTDADPADLLLWQQDQLAAARAAHPDVIALTYLMPVDPEARVAGCVQLHAPLAPLPPDPAVAGALVQTLADLLITPLEFTDPAVIAHVILDPARLRRLPRPCGCDGCTGRREAGIAHLERGGLLLVVTAAERVH